MAMFIGQCAAQFDNLRDGIEWVSDKNAFCTGFGSSSWNTLSPPFAKGEPVALAFILADA